MIGYDKDTNIMTIKQVNVPDADFDLLDDLKSSYDYYLYNTLRRDIELFFEKIGQKTNGKLDLIVKKFGVSLQREGFSHDKIAVPRRNYEVYISLAKSNRPNDETEEFMFMELPHMDARGVFNFDGALKTLNNVLSASEDITYNQHKQTINIQLGQRNAPFSFDDSKRTYFGFNKTKAPIDQLILAQLMIENNKEWQKELNVLHNSVFKVASNIIEGFAPETAYANSKPAAVVLHSRGYKLTKDARNNLNRALQLDRAIGETLSQDVYSEIDNSLLAKTGEVITATLIKTFKKHAVWRIYVRHVANLLAFRLENDILIQHIPEGTYIGKFLATEKNLQQGRYTTTEMPFITVDDLDLTTMKFDPAKYMARVASNVEVQISKKKALDRDISEFLFDMNYGDFGRSISLGKTIAGSTYYFEVYLDKEIITNRTFHHRDVINSGSDTDVWYIHEGKGKFTRQDLSTYRVDNLDISPDPIYPFNGSTLSSRDLLALLSILGNYMTDPDSNILPDKDDMLLKRLNLTNEVFSQAMGVASDTFLTKVHGNLTSSLSRLPEQFDKSVFRGFSATFRSTLVKLKAIEMAELLNPASILAQTTNVSYASTNTNTSSDAQRALALSFYGRICPYETPSSTKIGLVNHKAIGCKIVDGLLKTCYRKITRSGDTAIMGDTKIWLSTLEASMYKIGDMLDLKFVDGTTHRKFSNTKVMAMVPNSSRVGDKVIVDTIDALDLDYVFFSPEQHVSSTAALIPFLGADDPARVSFALSMMKQTIFCQENEKPRVFTSMYQRIFDNMPAYYVKAEASGVIDQITPEYIYVFYDNDAKVEDVKESGVFSLELDIETVNAAGLEVQDKFNKGTYILNTIMEGVDTTEVAPYDCEITDIKYGTVHFKQITGKKVHRTPTQLLCKSIVVSGHGVTFMNYNKVPGDRFNKGDILAHASIMKDGIYAPARNALVAYIPTGYNYEDAVDMSQNCASHYTSISLNKQEISVNSHGGQLQDIIPSDTYVRDGYPLAKIIVTGDWFTNGAHTPTLMADKVSGYVYCKNKDFKASREDRFRDYYNIFLLGFNREGPADKKAGRHGNKGVVSNPVTPNSKQPMFRNGKIVDLCLNPCGVPSRMNIGQNLEAHLGFIAEVLDIYIKSESFNGATKDDIVMLMSYVYDLANSDPATWKSVTEKYKLPAALYEHITNKIERIKDWEGAFHRDGTADLWDPVTQRWYQNRISFGYSYMLKLEQEGANKIHSREGLLTENYVAATQQPVKGRAKDGGQRAGEMEIINLAAYGAVETLHEALNEKSDNVGARYNAHAAVIPEVTDDLAPARECVPRANDVLRYLLQAMGIHPEVSGNGKELKYLPPTDRETTEMRQEYDGKYLEQALKHTRVRETEDKAEILTELDKY